MPQKKHKPEEIVAKLRQVYVLLSQGRSVGEAVRLIGVTDLSSKPEGPSISMTGPRTPSWRPLLDRRR